MVDYGLGNCANSLELGCDCLGHIQYFDGVLSDSKGALTSARTWLASGSGLPLQPHKTLLLGQRVAVPGPQCGARVHSRPGR